MLNKGPKLFGKGCTEWPRIVKPSLNSASLCGFMQCIRDRQTDRQTPRTSVTVVCISCIRCMKRRNKRLQCVVACAKRQNSWAGDRRDFCTHGRTVGDRAFAAAGPTFWNSLPHDITDGVSLTSFCRKLKTFFVFYIISTTTFSF